jgi:methyltransferase of ATP-grasp peptide maturase system
MTKDEEVRVRLERLADTIATQGALRCPRWREAVVTVPRDVFLPRFYRRTAGTFDHEPVTRAAVGDQRWLDMVYADETWVTQVDGSDDLWTRHPEPRTGRGTCSSTMPSLVVEMLEALDVSDGDTVMEIGTGTGYSTALLCQRLGAQQVVSVEIDRRLSRHARGALERLGYQPTLVVGDGDRGWPAGAPYDGVIGTCSFTKIPYAWVEQTRPGGRLAVILTGSITGGPLAVLDVVTAGAAQGMLTAQMLGFMVSRPQVSPPLPPAVIPRKIPAHDQVSTIDHTVLDDDRVQFLLQSRMPNLTYRGLFHASEQDAIFRTPDPERWAYAYLAGDGQLRIRNGTSPQPLWPIIEDTVRTWVDLGHPNLDAFRLDVTADQQTLSVPGTHIRWRVFI